MAEESLLYQPYSGNYCHYRDDYYLDYGDNNRICGIVPDSIIFHPRRRSIRRGGKFLSVNVTEMIDLYLIGLVLIIMSLGLYQLFIDSDVNLPEWLDTPSFDILKARLLIVVAVVLPVMFLGYAATATDGIFIAGLGIAI
jgi:hypothetical protein